MIDNLEEKSKEFNRKAKGKGFRGVLAEGYKDKDVRTGFMISVIFCVIYALILSLACGTNLALIGSICLGVVIAIYSRNKLMVIAFSVPSCLTVGLVALLRYIF